MLLPNPRLFIVASSAPLILASPPIINPDRNPRLMQGSSGRESSGFCLTLPRPVFFINVILNGLEGAGDEEPHRLDGIDCS